jgi:hypothetical protein
MSAAKAGFGKVDITPKIGVELFGFGPYINRYSTSVYEPIFARAMAVEAGDDHWVIVSCDLGIVDARLTEKVRSIIRSNTGWSEESVMVHATHTHVAPATHPDYLGWGEPYAPYLEVLPRYVAEACIKAIEDLQEATFHHATPQALGLSYNRGLDATTRTNDAVLNDNWITDKPEETDTIAHVVRVDRNNKVAGFFSYFSCHPVVCCQNSTEISGDFVGVATNRVEKDFPGSVGLFLQGALGDINSNYVWGPRDQSLIALDKFANKFASVIREGIKTATPITVTSTASILQNEFYTVADFDEEDLINLLRDNEQLIHKSEVNTPDSKARLAVIFVCSIRKILESLHREEKLNKPLCIQSFRLGPITLTSTPLEVFHRIKRRFQKEAGEKALLLSVTNDHLGYAPIRERYLKGRCYETFQVPFISGSVPFTEKIEDELLAATLKSVRELGGIEKNNIRPILNTKTFQSPKHSL